MCDPTAIAIGSLVIGAASSEAKASSEAAASRANRAEAIRAMREQSKDISLEQVQQQDATARTIYETDREARSSQALAHVSAGEAGVTGISVQALLGDIDRKRGEFASTERRNLGMVLASLQREKITGRQTARSRIAAVPPPSPFALGLSIASQGLEFWAGQVGRKASSTTTSSSSSSRAQDKSSGVD